jgi:hypothetical protein
MRFFLVDSRDVAILISDRSGFRAGPFPRKTGAGRASPSFFHVRDEASRAKRQVA